MKLKCSCCNSYIYSDLSNNEEDKEDNTKEDNTKERNLRKWFFVLLGLSVVVLAIGILGYYILVI